MPKRKNEEYDRINRFDWKKVKDWVYPYKGNTFSDPNYIKDKATLFNINGNGWWWGPGWWSTKKFETPMEYHARKRKERAENVI